jgi:hypothetical protein
MDMMGMMPEAEMRRLEKPETRGMRRNWFAGMEALHTIVRVLPQDLYDKVVSGKEDIPPGASVPGAGPGEMPGMHGDHQHGGKEGSKKDDKARGQHEHHH